MYGRRQVDILSDPPLDTLMSTLHERRCNTWCQATFMNQLPQEMLNDRLREGGKRGENAWKDRRGEECFNAERRQCGDGGTWDGTRDGG